MNKKADQIEEHLEFIKDPNAFQQRQIEQRKFLERTDLIRRAFNKYVTEVPFNIVGKDGDYHIKVYDPFKEKVRIFRLNDELIGAIEGIVLEYMTIDYSLEQIIKLDHPASEELAKLRMAVLEEVSNDGKEGTEPSV